MSREARLSIRQKIEKLASRMVVILCGHYEESISGLSTRWDMEEVSGGDYILTGGELPAMVLIDSVSGFIPDVLGTESLCRRRINLLEGFWNTINIQNTSVRKPGSAGSLIWKS